MSMARFSFLPKGTGWTRLLPRGSLLFIITGMTMSPAPAMQDISGELKPLVAKTAVPALAVAVVLDGEIVAAGATGKRKKGSPEEVTLADKFHLGSCTKSMTATLAAIMVQEGKIRWDSTPAEIFKGFPIHEGFQKATLLQLLSNTGGCPGDIDPRLWNQLWLAQGTPAQQRLKLARGILGNAPAYPPGGKYEYSNAGFSIAGAMMETASGVPYETMLAEKLFQPLGMDSAGFRAPATPGKIDQPYGHDPGPVEPEPKGDNPRAIAPAGAVHCSVIDWAKYARLHLGSGAVPLLQQESLDFLHAPVSTQPPYAPGWILVQRSWAGGTALTHTGSNTTFYSVIWLAPAKKFAVVALCNTGEKKGFEACDQAIGLMIRKYLEHAPGA